MEITLRYTMCQYQTITTQETKYHRDAQALMEMAQEVTTSTEYSFAYALACHDTMIELIIRNLFDKNKKIVSHIAALILTHLINTNAEIHAAIIAQIMAALSTALSIASDQSLIDNSNESFPDDLKYVERKAKVNKYFAVVTLLMQLHPTVVIPQLTAPDNWSILCETVAALESGADTFSWAKNDDKLMVMQIIIDCIDKYTVDPQQLFHMKLVDALTSQYLVSTRSTVVSQHMTQVVSITYRLLRHFAFDNETGAAWIGAKIVNQHWFLWAISDIVTPHNVYQSSIAAHSILVFIEKMMSLDLECVKSAPTQMIEKCVKKWDQMPHSKKLNQYPRDTILQLLMLILRTEADHIQFLRHLHGRKLISQWINNFFLCNVLGDKEAIATYNIAFDFFNFYLAQIAAFGALQTELGTQVVSLFIDAICSVFAYDSCRNDVKGEWKQILKRGLQTLQGIFDFEKSLENVHIMKHFFHKLSQSEILMFSSNPKDYVRSKNTTDSEEMVMQYLSSIRHPPNGIAAQIGTKCAFVESKKHMYCYQMSALLEIFVANYAQFDWNDDHFDVETQGCIAAVMISAWFLLQVGCALPDVIVHHMSQYFAAAEHVPFKYHPVCWVSFVVLMTSDAFQPQMLRDPLNMKLCLSLTKATLDSVLDVADNSDSKLLKDVKTKTLLKYLPVRFELCCDQIIANKDASSLLFIEYYHHAIQYNSIIVSAKPKFWTSLRRKMDLIMSGSNDDKIIEYLREIAMIIDHKIQKSRENPPPDVVMANEKNKVIKTKTVNKKSKKALPLQIKFNQNKTTTKPPPPPPPPPAPQQNDAPQTMAVDTKKDDDEDK
eukprot:1121612_1